MTSYRPEIDGLRAVAICAVIAYHLDPGLLASGLLGVDMFFVISGYVITAALGRRADATLSAFLLEFYARRMKRLAPALALCALVSGLALCLVEPEPRRSLETGISALFGLSNIQLLGQATDYFAAPARMNLFTQTWSLGVEEQFYLVFPLLLWSLSRDDPDEHRRRTRMIVIGGLALASFAGWVAARIIDPAFAFYAMPTRFWELGTGALCFFAADGRQPSARAAGLATPALVLAVAAMFIPGAPGVALVVVATAVLISTISPGGVAHAMLSHRGVVAIGRVSYSLYLWHWAVLLLGLRTIGHGPAARALQVVLMAVLAVASYRLVESPLRRATWSRTPSRTILLGLAMLAGVAVLLAWPMDGRLYSGQRLVMASTGTGSLTREYRVPGRPEFWLGTRCIVAGQADVGKQVRLPDCTLGDFATAHRRILVLGDSFSASFVPGFERLVALDGYAVSIVSAWGASPAPSLEAQGPWAASSRHYWSDVVPGLVSQLRPGDLVFLATDLAGYAPPTQDAAARQELASLRRAIGDFAAALRHRQIGLAMLHANPPAREAACEPADAMPQWYRLDTPCTFATRQSVLARRKPLDDMLGDLSKRSGVTVVDLIDEFCPREDCSYVAGDGSILYRDAHSHPSVEAVRLAAPAIRTAVLTTFPARPGATAPTDPR